MILENVGLITPKKRKRAQILLDINTDHVASIQSPQPSTSGFVRKRPVIYSSDSETDTEANNIHSLMLMNNTLHKKINLYSSEEEEEELEPKDKIPLANLKSKETKSPFQELMPTPNFAVIKNKPRRKAINYKGQRITKDLFSNREKTKENEKSKIQKKKGLKPKIENMKKTLRAASDKGKVNKTKTKCYHEECIELTNKDKEIFYCCA
ncbi:hypothetical protein FQR65_LT10410 [Abscondita terminalis]|nr:hypothetical protein FQR65_LT10410 [Abscondita terminalis]